MLDVLRLAVEGRSKVVFYYKGGMRTVEPYCVGISYKGRTMLRGYQVHGYSSGKQSWGWRLFDVDEMSSLSVLDDAFDGERPGYNPNDSHMVTVLFSV